MRLLVLAFLFCSNALYAQSPAIAINLKTEHLVNPLGIDESHPRLSWQVQDSRLRADAHIFEWK